MRAFIRHTAPWRASRASAGSTSASDRPLRAIIGRQARSPRSRVCRSTRASGRAAATSRRRVHDRGGKRLDEAREDRRARRGKLRYGCVAPRREEGDERQIVRRARARGAACRCEDPPRQRPGIGPQRPALAGPVIEKRDRRRCHLQQRVAAADGVDIGECRVVGAEDDVAAVVDGAVEQRLEIGPAAAAGARRRLVEADAHAGARQAHRRREAGEPGADDMRGGHERASTIARSAVQSWMWDGTRTRPLPGGAAATRARTRR